MAEASAAGKRRRAAPKGYEKKNSDVSGYWEEESGPIHFIPRSAKLLDGNIDKKKPSIIIVGELVERTIVAAKDKDPWEAQVGEIVGVWYKPGMRDIAQCAGLRTWLDQDLDDNDVQKTKKMKVGNPMKLYVVQSAAGTARRIPITEDTRKESRNVATPFDDPNIRPLRTRAARTETPDDVEEEDQVDDNVPF